MRRPVVQGFAFAAVIVEVEVPFQATIKIGSRFVVLGHESRKTQVIERDAGQVDTPAATLQVYSTKVTVLAVSLNGSRLTDYQVVVIGVTNRETKTWADGAMLVRTAEGLCTDAPTLAAQIGLAKAMQKFDLRELRHIPPLTVVAISGSVTAATTSLVCQHPSRNPPRDDR